jgi:gallate dioxygenase
MTSNMMRDKLYKDIPGTTLFDADQSRMGYHLNQFCMSLMKPENRERFKADQRAYLDEWPMTEDQKQAVLDLDLNRCIALGGNIYFLAKIGSTFGMSFQQMAGTMTGLSEAAYRDMMVGGGRPVEGNRIKDNPNRDPNRQAPEGHGQVTGAIFSSHVPAMGAAMDLGKTEEPYWKPIFDGYEPTRQWLKENTPDVVFLVYNDHATAFDARADPHLRARHGRAVRHGRRGLRAAPVPDVMGHPELAWHLAAVADPRRVRHDARQRHGGRPRPHRAAVGRVRPTRRVALQGRPARRQRRAVPAAHRQPLLPARPGDPSGDRLVPRWRASSCIFGTGGMSHQLQGPTRRADQHRVGQPVPRPAHERPLAPGEDRTPRVPPRGRQRGHRARDVADHARCAMADQAVDARADVAPPSIVRRFYHVPASNSAVGHLVLDDTANIPSTVTA